VNRHASVTVDLKALRHNLSIVRSVAKQQKVMAVVKADAYGHGMIEAARALDDADALGVAFVSEGVALREAGIDKPILVMEGARHELEVAWASKAGLMLAIHDEYQIHDLPESLFLRPELWLKLDTGMHRLGFPPFECRQRLEALKALPAVAEVAGVLTHLANADDLGDDYTRVQLERFEQATGGLVLPRSVANSAAILGWPETHLDWVRPGIMLYGASPFAASREELRPAMTFTARIVSIKEVEKGAPIGYGGDWTAPERMPVAAVAVGYGDGYPRLLSNRGEVVVAGRRVPIVGRVCMDMTLADVSAVPGVHAGDEAVLIGTQGAAGITADAIAAWTGTINYEVTCAIGLRVPREYR